LKSDTFLFQSYLTYDNKLTELTSSIKFEVYEEDELVIEEQTPLETEPQTLVKKTFAINEFPLSINHFEVLDNSDNIITEICTGYPIVIKSEIKNNESLLVDYTIIYLIEDEFGNRQSLSIIDDSIQGNSLKTSTYLWIPQVAGEYTITCFVWESIDNPAELATRQTMSLLVKEEKSNAPNLGFDFTKTIDSPLITLQNTGIFKDMFYSYLDKPTQGVEILLTSDIVNTKNKLIPFTYALQIENDQQEIIYYSQISTSLYSQETHKIIDSWIPQDFGNFTVKSIALDKTYRGDFLPISESDEFKIFVTEDPTFGLECPYCPTTFRIGEVQWLEASYPLNSTGIVRVIDRDKNLDPKLIDTHIVKIWSDSDTDGIELIVTETNEGTGIFEGSVFFTTNDKSSGDKLRVSNGDIVTAKYVDDALPEPYTTADELEIIATTLTGTIESSSPKKQLELGIASENIICKVHLELIFKSNNSPVCVKPATAEKLIERGWGHF